MLIRQLTYNSQCASPVMSESLVCDDFDETDATNPACYAVLEHSSLIRHNFAIALISLTSTVYRDMTPMSFAACMH